MNIWPLVRLGMILAGLAGGGLFIYSGSTSEVIYPEAEHQKAEKNNAYILQTVRPLAEGRSPLASPLSLEHQFGRAELTGQRVRHIPKNPLEALDFDRQWDFNLDLEPPEPSNDLPPAQATDEVMEPEPEEVVEYKQIADMSDLPEDVQRRAEDAKAISEEAYELYFEGVDLMQSSADGRDEANRLLGEAVEKFKKARDILHDAAKNNPAHAVLMDIMRDIKSGLFAANKYRTG
ncbi:MAG: hypothetical protein V3V10_00085 [Planctomycetota bacterium]